MTKTFTATIWEKAEHWTFETTVEAKDEIEARKLLAKEFPARSYNIRECVAYWSPWNAKAK